MHKLANEPVMEEPACIENSPGCYAAGHDSVGPNAYMASRHWQTGLRCRHRGIQCLPLPRQGACLNLRTLLCYRSSMAFVVIVILAGQTQQLRLNQTYKEFKQWCTAGKVYPSIDKFCVCPCFQGKCTINACCCFEPRFPA